MHWDIPPPYDIPHVKPPRWDRWWRCSTLVSGLLLLVAAALWFWLKDGRIWLYAFAVIVAWGLLCAMVAGWMMYRDGVDREHQAGLHWYNHLLEEQWQRWAQKGLAVLNYSFILPSAVPPVSLASQQVTCEEALSAGPYPGAVVLIQELLLPLLSTLHALLQHHSLAVSLPASVTVADFHQAYQNTGLPLDSITEVRLGDNDIFSRLFQWTEVEDCSVARLVVLTDWADESKYTQGAVAWLLAPEVDKSRQRVRCTLHRPKQAVDGETTADIRQFLHYQPLAQQASDLWLSAGALPLVAPFMAQRAICLQAGSSEFQFTPELTQHHLPHWLGRVSENSPFFALTLMMQMAECRPGTQVLLHTGNNALIFCSISAGAVGHE